MSSTAQESTNSLPTVAIVVIGKNEEKHLHSCFSSIRKASAEFPLVYVDSASTDNSVAIAKTFKADIVELNPYELISPARARNEGFKRISQLYPNTKYIQFVDGDCALDPQWIDNTVGAFLASNKNIAIICGRLTEIGDKSSIYNRMAEIEWDHPPGETASCGGIFIVKTRQFDEIGGFNQSFNAGEEPELCYRLRRKGYKILRLDAQMAWHDSDMQTFKQWWARQIRTGYGGLYVNMRTDKELYASTIKSARLWAIGWPSVTAFMIIAGFYCFGPGGVALGLCSGIAVLAIQIARISIQTQNKGFSMSLSIAYAFFTLLSKLAQVIGQARLLRHLRSAAKQPTKHITS